MMMSSILRIMPLINTALGNDGYTTNKLSHVGCAERFLRSASIERRQHLSFHNFVAQVVQKGALRRKRRA